MAQPDNAGRDAGGRFRKGHSGNPKGCLTGSRHKATLAAEALLDGETENLTRKAIEMAKAGDATAMRLCLERILAPRRDRPVSVELPTLRSAGDAVKAMAAITEAVAKSELTPVEAADLSSLVSNYVRAIEVSELAQRVAVLEKSAVGETGR
jgi:hypothetical protein